MATGTSTYGLHETFIEPQVLPPPPVRQALFAFVVDLASILHIVTAPWSEIHNGPEGMYASAAREMVQSGKWLMPQQNGIAAPDQPPLLLWLIVGSYEVFGVSPMAARVPIALAMVSAVALTFLIGERLAGYWRGFVAALIHLCSCGAFIWGRIVTPEPITAALIAAAIFCGVCGYQQRRYRRAWFASWWLFAALAYLTSGASAIFVLAATFLLLSLFFREARLRFRTLLHWSYLGAFAAVVVGWHLLLQAHYPGWLSEVASSPWLIPFSQPAAPLRADGTSLPWFLITQTAWLFPAVLLVLPGAIIAWRKIARPHEIEAADALPLCWLAAGFLPLLLIPHRQEYQSIIVWSAFALWAASAWDRMSRALQLSGIVLATVTGLALTVAAWLGRLPGALLEVPIGRNFFGSVPLAVGGAIVAFAIAGAYLVWRERERLAVTLLMLGAVPVGLAAADGMARLGEQFSLARAARFLETRLGEEGEVIFEGPREAGSSLGFYLHRRFFVIASGYTRTNSAALDHSQLTEEQAVEKLAATHPVYLIIHKKRVSHWQQRLTERFHIYHQVTSSGPHVVINNRP